MGKDVGLLRRHVEESSLGRLGLYLPQQRFVGLQLTILSGVWNRYTGTNQRHPLGAFERLDIREIRALVAHRETPFVAARRGLSERDLLGLPIRLNHVPFELQKV